jgi:sulfonate transport system substrate-binding protein
MLSAQKAGKYSDQVRDEFIALKRQYRYFPVNDERFLSELQRAADWLVARKVLPEPIKVTDHLAQI